MFTSHLCRLKRPYHSHFYFRKYQPGLSSCKGAVRKAKEVKCFQEKYIERGKNSKGSNKSFLTLFQISKLKALSFMKSNSSHKRQNNNFWYSSLPDDFRLSYLNYTRSYAALRAADLDWIIGPGYSLRRVHSEEKP